MPRPESSNSPSKLQFVAALPTFDTDQAAQLVWHWLEDKLQNASGVCYYKYPIVGFGGTEIPDFTLLVRGYQPFAIRCVDFDLVDIQDAATETWQVRDTGKSKRLTHRLRWQTTSKFG
jgi:hypothetical protein